MWKTPLFLAAFLVLGACERPNHDIGSDNAGESDAMAHEQSSESIKSRRAIWPPLTDNADTLNAQASNAINYYIVLDGSGSMLSRECAGNSTKMQAALDAVLDFIGTVPKQANIGLAAFDKRVIAERVPLGSDNRDALVDALSKIRAGSDTPLRSTIQIAYNKLTEQGRKQLGYGEYHLIVVTDGQPDPDDEDPTPIVNKILAASPVVIHTIGFCIDEHHVLNQKGRVYYASANNPQQLQKSLSAVLAEADTFDATAFAAP